MNCWLIVAGVALEAGYPKYGNVSPCSEREDLKYSDLILSAIAIAESCKERKLGRRLRIAIERQRKTALVGLAILSVPVLPHLNEDDPLSLGFEEVMNSTVEDANELFKALTKVTPSHLGYYESSHPCLTDVRNGATCNLYEIAKAMEDDMIFRELANNYPLTRFAYKYLKNCLGEWGPCIKSLQKELLSRELDTLIVRKHGIRKALEVRELARANLLHYIDVNPGSTADIIALAITLVLRDQI